MRFLNRVGALMAILCTAAIANAQTLEGAFNPGANGLNKNHVGQSSNNGPLTLARVTSLVSKKAKRSPQPFVRLAVAMT